MPGESEGRAAAPVVILCGGEGTRFWEETYAVPKPSVEIGEHPALWHVMNIFAPQGSMIRDYFLNYALHSRDSALELGGGPPRFRGQAPGRGKTVVGYGAAAECMTMLNYCGVSTGRLAAMGDANPRKQGLFCAGVRIPVVSPDELMRHRPDSIMIGV